MPLSKCACGAMMWCVSGPSRKATLSLICIAEASQPDLASPAYSRPSTVTLHDIITKHLLLPHNVSRNHCVYPASPLHLPCVLHPRLVTPVSRVTLRSPASPCVLLRHPAFSCVLLHSPAFSCIILCLRLASSAVSLSLECSVGSSDRNKSIPLPASIFPRVPIIRSPFCDPLNPSILLPVPRVQFRGDFVSGLSKSSSPFPSPFSVSLRVRSSVIPSSSLLSSAVSAVVSRSSSLFVALKAVVCFSFPPSSPNCSYRVPSSRRTRFRI